MSAASSSRRTTPTRSMSPRRATSWPTTSPTCSAARDGGRSWKSINGDLPGDEITRVVRADPVAKGLLFVGTETGIHFSLDDGASWPRMPGGLPVVPVYDLKLKDTDLVAGTHGRSFWILDDVTPLRGLTEAADGDAPLRAAHGDPHQAALERRRQRAHRHRLRPGLRHRRQHRHGRESRRHRGLASISMSARTRRTARSSITGWPRMPRRR